MFSRVGLVILLTVLPLATWAQDPTPDLGWQHQDLQTDHIFGVSTNRVDHLLDDHPAATPVIVAVIDVGIDIDHPALHGVLWHNVHEQPDNQQDDDHNGYVDDVNGWNFLYSAAAGGNANVQESMTGPYAGHGTHVAGIIAAIHNPTVDMRGIADDVRIMAVRAIPSTGQDEHDEDVAKAIRYAVDNGARVLNLSFDKAESPHKALVDSAVQYAMAHNVLIVHSAGNDGVDIDRAPLYPNPVYADGTGRAEAWIEVGASGPRDDSTLVWPFSNYGQHSVDVFAPGVGILSAVLHGHYEAHDGTSMAAPVVSGIAALLWSRYPTLTAVQVKRIIVQSVVPVSHTVLVGNHSVAFTSLCVSGGIVNAYTALQLAPKIASQR